MDFERDYDVVVAGGGVAGIAAALECARAGLDTALVEKTVLLGGLATSGLINIYLPLCDGYGRQALFGIAEELLHLSIKYGPGAIPPGWAHRCRELEQAPGISDTQSVSRYSTPFSPAAFALALDEALIEAGVSLWLDTLVCAAVREGRRIAGIEVENKSGRGVLRARCTIDATGDADVAYRAGAPCVESDNWLSLWAAETSLARARQVVNDPEHASLLEMVRVGADANGRGHPVDQPKFFGTDGQQVTGFVLEGRRLLREAYQTRQNEIGEAGRHRLFPVTLPSMAQFRTTRRIVGVETMAPEPASTPLETAIGVIPDWRRPAPVREVPYGALVARDVQDLLVAGRCMSAEGEAWEVARVIPPAAFTGQVAGVVATLTVQRDITPDRLPVSEVQAALQAKEPDGKGWPLHATDISK